MCPDKTDNSICETLCITDTLKIFSNVFDTFSHRFRKISNRVNKSLYTLV